MKALLFLSLVLFANLALAIITVETSEYKCGVVKIGATHSIQINATIDSQSQEIIESSLSLITESSGVDRKIEVLQAGAAIANSIVYFAGDITVSSSRHGKIGEIPTFTYMISFKNVNNSDCVKVIHVTSPLTQDKPIEQSNVLVQSLSVQFQNKSADKDTLKRVGTPAKIQIDNFEFIDTLFIGRMISIDGKGLLSFVKTDGSNEVLTYPDSLVKKISDVDGNSIQLNLLEPQLLGFEQGAGVNLCAAVSTFNLLRLIYANNQNAGNGNLAKQLKDTESQLTLYSTLMYKLFVKNSNVSPKVINENFRSIAVDFGLKWARFGETFDLSLYDVSNKDPIKKVDEFKQFLTARLKSGRSVVLFFVTQDQMYGNSFKTTMTDLQGKQTTESFPETFVPLKPNQKVVGAHTVIISGIFDLNGKEYLLISDPNEKYSQIWPSEYLDQAQNAKMFYWSLF